MTKWLSVSDSKSMNQNIIVLAVLSMVLCDTMVFSNTSRTLQNMSTSGIWQTMKMFDILYNIQTTCITFNKGMGISQYCHELIQENNNYIPLNNVIRIKTDKIHSVLVNLLILEKQAVICRCTRNLLHIIMYGTFINNILNESIENYSSEIQKLDKLFKMHSSEDQNFDYENTIQEIEEFIKNKKSKNQKMYNSQNCQINQSKEKLIETYSIFIEKITTIIQYSHRFIIKELNMFSELYDKIHKVMTLLTIDIKNYGGFLLFIFKELYIVYKSECFPDADVALLFKSDHTEKIKQEMCPIPRLTEEVDQLIINVRNDFKLLYKKFFPIIRNNIIPGTSMVYYHSFNMYHDSEIWRLIGNEIIVDKIHSPAEVTVLNNIILKKEKIINNITDKLTLAIENSVRCSCLNSINKTLKSHYFTIQILIKNVYEIQKTSETIAQENFAIKEYIKKISDDSSHVMNVSKEELSDIFNSFNDRIQNLVIDQYYTINDSNKISSTIDDLNRNKSIKNEFKSVFIIYSKYNFHLIDELIQTISYYSLSLHFEMNQFESMLKDMESTMYKVERGTVEKLMKWYKRSTQMYKDNNCFSNDDNDLFHGSNENYNQKITLGLLAANNYELDRQLEYDLKRSTH